MNDTTTNDTSAERARALFAGEKLPFPPVPSEAGTALAEVGPNVFSTRPLETGPYSLEVYSLEAQDAPAPGDYAVIGFDGYGSNSWAVHYFRVEAGLALFVQLPWGGAYVDPEEARSEVAAAFAWAAALQDRVRAAVAGGVIPKGWRLLAVVSEFAESGWAWVPSPPPGADAIDWHAVREVRQAVDTALADVIAGRTKLG